MCKANIPRSRFLFKLVKYSYPWRFRSFIGINRDKLVLWSSERTYRKYLIEFESKGFLKRDRAYSTGIFSIEIKLNWEYNSTNAFMSQKGKDTRPKRLLCSCRSSLAGN